MSISKFDDVKDLLLSRNIKIISDIEPDLICGICRTIVKEPYMAICGCTHCRQCIGRYVQSGGRRCPGKKNECQNSFLDRETDLYLDLKTNIKLGKLVAKCPNELCTAESTLADMKQHIDECANRFTFCPFFSIGCDDNSITQGTMENHLRDNSCNHCNMMVEHINNTKNYMDSMIKEYEERINAHQMEIETLRSQMNANKETMHLQQEELRDLRENRLLNPHSSLVTNHGAMDGHIRSIIGSIIVILAVVVSYGIYIQRMNEGELNNHKQQIQSMKENINELEFGEFVWKIENFRQKQMDAKTENQTMIESDHFYSHRNGYRLKLQMYPNGVDYHRNVHLSVHLVMTVGPYDDILKWPFAQGVKITFINQNSGADFKSVFDYNNGVMYPSLKRVTNDKYNRAADLRFDLTLFDTMPGLVKNDTVYISCWVKPYTP